MDFRTLFDLFSLLLEKYQKNKLAFIFAFLLSCSTVYQFREPLYTWFGLRQDITKEYIKKTQIVESKLHSIRKSVKCDDISVFLLHNGEVTISNLHLMKFTLIFNSSDIPNNGKFIFHKIPFSPFVNYFNDMIQDGYFYVPNCANHADPLIRDIYEKRGKSTITYYPLYQNNILIGFTIVSYNDVTPLPKKKIIETQRYLEQLNGLI